MIFLNPRLYRNKKWLYDQYWNKKKSTLKIGKECNVTSGVIQYWMKKFNIPRREASPKGKNNPQWKGGRSKRSDGYIRKKDYNHPKSDGRDRVLEHILIAEKKLGRYLKDNEIVHHINFIKDDNRPENLYVSKDRSTHQKITNSLFKLINYLLENKIIVFNKEKEIYEVLEP